MAEELTTEAEPEPGPFGFAIAANIVEFVAQGPGGLEVRRGTRHFPPGAKVWVVPQTWDWTDRLRVVGRHWGRFNRYIAVVMRKDRLENVRVRAVHSPALARALDGATWRPLWGSAEEAQAVVDGW
ncbi:hypothetical protein ACIA8O_26675 [Kitasatospora sp. NPDC051853]|uniref:hypothetical protein n=1 Tax=Kitasatospora sp. NPDC051853 TaxID=3364058 RepID=UPI0037AD2C19